MTASFSEPLRAERALLRAQADARRTLWGDGGLKVSPALLALGLRTAAAALNGLERVRGGVAHVGGLGYGAGPDRQLDLYWPLRAPSRMPTIVFFGGGAWRSRTREHVGFAARALARLGFLVAAADVRLAPRVRFPAFMEDAAAAVAWTRRAAPLAGADPDRLVVMGHSSGAHIALLLALDPRHLRRVGAPAPVGAVGLAGPYDFHPFPLPLCEEALGGPHDPRVTQPIQFVRRDAPPTLLVAGERDAFVPPENSLSLHGALTAAGAESTLRLYPKLGHLGALAALTAGGAMLGGPVLDDVRGFLQALPRQPMGGRRCA